MSEDLAITREAQKLEQREKEDDTYGDLNDFDEFAGQSLSPEMKAWAEKHVIITHIPKEGT